MNLPFLKSATSHILGDIYICIVGTSFLKNTGLGNEQHYLKDTVCSVYLNKDMIGSFSKLRGGSNNPDS